MYVQVSKYFLWNSFTNLYILLFGPNIFLKQFIHTSFQKWFCGSNYFFSWSMLFLWIPNICRHIKWFFIFDWVNPHGTIISNLFQCESIKKQEKLSTLYFCWNEDLSRSRWPSEINYYHRKLLIDRVLLMLYLKFFDYDFRLQLLSITKWYYTYLYYE